MIELSLYFPAVVVGQALPFVHPQFALAAAGAAAIPIVIHLINRRRYVTVPWAAMRFLQAAGKRSAHRMMLEHWVLLAIRMAVIALLCLAVARPFFPIGALGGLGRSRTHRVLVIDNSASMSDAADAPDATRGRWLAAVGELVASFPPGDAVSLVTASEPAEAVLAYAAYDRRRARDALSEVKVTLRGTDMAGALSAASAILAESEFPPDGRVVYVVSDLPANGWGASAVAAARKVAGQVRRNGLVFVRVGDGDSRPNVAVTGLREASGARVWLDPRDATRGLLRMEADVANYSDHGVKGVHLRVRVAGEHGNPRDAPRGRSGLAVDALGPFEVRTVPFSVMPGRGGDVIVGVTVSAATGDALAGDDQRWRSVEVSGGVSVLLVEGRTGATTFLGDAGYLSAALSPESQPGSPAAIKVRTLASSALGAEPMEPYDVIGLCNVGRLRLDVWTRLADFVREGGGLLVFGGDRFDLSVPHPSRRGQRLSDGSASSRDAKDGAPAPAAGGSDLLPVRVVGVVGDSESEADSVGFAPQAFTHPVLADFAGHAESGLFRARVWRRLVMEPVDARADVLLRFTDGRPALVSGRFGDGHVVVCATSADMRWTNLPAKGDYVSLMANVVTWLAPLRGQQRTVAVGDSIREQLDPAESGLPLRVRHPDGQSSDGGMVLESGRFSLVYGPVEQRGVYAATIGQREVLFAVNVDARESDLRSIDEGALRDLLECEFTFTESQDLAGRSVARASTHEVGSLLLYAVIVLAAVESWVAMRFGAYR